MQIFSKLYQIILNWAGHKNSVYYLSALSFIESFILPYPPPDVMLAPMVFKHPSSAYQFALFCTLFSVLGGVVGYSIGALALDIILPFLTKMHYLDKLDLVKTWFNEYDIFIIAIAGFSPMPYKIFTIGAGVVSMALLPFILMSLIARGARFFLVTFLVKKFGGSCDTWLKKYIDRLGYGLIVVIIIGAGYAKVS